MKRHFLIPFIIIIAITLSACNAPVNEPTEPPISSPAQTGAPTASAALAETGEPPAPTPTATFEIMRLDPSDPMGTPFHWKQLVNDSQFQLGEIDAEQHTVDIGTYPVLDGSTVAIPMAEEFARQHLGLNYPSIFVSFNTTHNAYMNLINGQKAYQDADYASSVQVASSTGEPDYLRTVEPTTDLIIATYPSEEELQTAADNGVELITTPVCHDAFVFVTYEDNPVDSLSIEQIRGIYTGEITNWNEVGGEDLPIRAYSRNPNSGSQTAMESLVMQGTPIAPSIASESTVDDMSTLLIAASSKTELYGALGYSYKYYLFQDTSEGQQYSPSDNLKTLGIEGVEPTPENIASGDYPFSVNYYGVIRKGDEQSSGGKFLDWMISEEGQASIRQAGYIALDGSFSQFYFDMNGFVFPESSERLLTQSDLERLQQYVYLDYEGRIRSLLGFARNEIFARHGNRFETEEYANHYAQYKWYNSLEPHIVGPDELSEIESANITVIQGWEKEWG